MYDVSSDYLEAMKRPVQSFRITGTIGEIPFSDRNILEGSLSVINQCSGSDNVQIGQVYVGELDVTFLKNLGLSKTFLARNTITLSHGLLVREGVYEDVPLGVYTVTEANWTESGAVVRAYDNMSKFDKSFSATSTNGTPYELASLACKSCGVELAQTADEFAAMPNGEETLYLDNENDIETWRDFMAWLSQAMGSFVTADRHGKIIFRQYGTEVVDTIDIYHRLSGCSFSDFRTRYTGMSCVNIHDNTTSYYSMDKDDALTYNLGSNPFLQLGFYSDTGNMFGDIISDIVYNNRIRRAVLDAISVIDYVPFTASMIGSPAYDLGDVLVFGDGIGDSEALCCITKYDFKYNDRYNCEGVGSNPALASAKSKSDKVLDSLGGRVSEQSVVISRYTNSEKYTLGSSNTSIMLLRVTSVKACTCLFDATILLDVRADSISLPGTDAGGNAISVSVDGQAVLTIIYELNFEKVTEHVPIEALASGKHIVTIHKAFSVGADTVNRFVLYASITGGSADIDVGGIEATVLGQGLSTSSVGWDGTIEIEEQFTPILIKSNDITIGSIKESLSTKTKTPDTSTITEVFSGILLDNSDLTISTGIIEDIISRFVVTASSINAENAALCIYNMDYVACDTAFKLITEYEYSAVEETIDRGRMMVLDMDFSEFANIDAITLSGYTPPSVLVRFDDPDVTWEQIGAMADAYYNDEITIDDVKQYWSVGDTRSADLSAMEATGVGEGHRAQTVQFVIGDFEHDDLTEPINGHTKALITLLQKDCLMDADCENGSKYGENDTERGSVNISNTNVGGWKECTRRTWCNEIYYNALPSGCRNAVKEVNKLTSVGNGGTSIETTADKIFLAAEIEIFGRVSHSVYGEGTQYTYYRNSTANRYKKPKFNSSYISQWYCERSPYMTGSMYFCRMGANGSEDYGNASGAGGIAVCVCI